MKPTSLPEPDVSDRSVSDVIANRSSQRTFADDPVTVATVGQLLWAAQGITHTEDGVKMRAAPSAGATYPLVCLLEVPANGVTDLASGVYRYEPEPHELVPEKEAAVRTDLVKAAGEQTVLKDAAATIVLTADYRRTEREYPDHGERYVHMEAGHVAENVLLVCEEQKLNACPVGAFRDETVTRVLELDDALAPLYLLPFGQPEGDRTE